MPLTSITLLAIEFLNIFIYQNYKKYSIHQQIESLNWELDAKILLTRNETQIERDTELLIKERSN